jgi:hypothetical protein
MLVMAAVCVSLVLTLTGLRDERASVRATSSAV